MSGTKPINLIARSFRGATLFLASQHTGNGSRWVADIKSAAKFEPQQAMTIAAKASREWGAVCHVTDLEGCIIERGTANEWRVECNYIDGQMDNVIRGKLGENFNRDPSCFRRYCEMQRNSAERAGFLDAAQHIQHCVDDLESRGVQA